MRTYQSERRRIAQDLIAFDHRFSRLFSGRPAKDAADEAGISMAEFKDAFEKGNMFASGIAVDYGASILVAKPGSATDQGDGTDVSPSLKAGAEKVVGKQEVAKNIKMGMRFPSFQVLNQSDARPWQFQQFLTSDGRFRIVVFAGNILDAAQMKRVQEFGSSLDSPKSFLHRFTPTGKKIDSVIEVLTVHSAPRTKVELLDLHEIFHPFDEKKGWDYNKVCVDDISYHEGHGEAYKNYGVDREKGCCVIVRPDQYVSWIGTLEDASEMDRYFSEFLVPQT